MKSIFSLCRIIMYWSAAVLCISCASAPKNEITIQPPSPPVSPVVDPEPKKKPAEENQLLHYKQKTGDIVLTIAAAPKVTTKGKPFSSPYRVNAKHADGTPAADFSITVSYPASRNNDDITFAEQTIETNEDGIAVFTPDTPEQTTDSIVRFYPAYDHSDGAVTAAQLKDAATAPWKVKTNLTYSGGSIALVDFSTTGKPITTNSVSSSNLLMNLMRAGFTRIGNADFTEAVASGSKDAVYKAAKSLLGSSEAYLIYGTIKYETPVTKTDTGYTCTLVADVTCLNMKDGSILYQTKRTATGTDAKEWNVLAAARKTLASDLSDAIVYGM